MTVSYIDSERALIGACLNGSKETQEWASSELRPDEFYEQANGRLWKALQSVLDDGLEVNPISVMDRSKVNQGALQACLDSGQGIAPSQLKTFIKDIRSAAQMRQLSSAFSEAVSECKVGSDPDKVLEGLEGKVYGKLGSAMSKGTADAKEVSHRVVKRCLDLADGNGGIEVSTGLELLDKSIIGLRPKFYVLGARPSMGKSALAQTITYNVLRQEGLGALTFSAEMDEEEIGQRSIAYYADVNVRKVMSGKGLEPAEVTRLIQAADAVPADKWRIIDRAVNIGTLRRIARIEANKMARKGIKLSLVVVDYIQLFADGDNREQAVSAVSRGCKLLSKELGCAVIGLSQLNRGLEHRDDKRPTMADLRESGALEQDADVIMFVYRPSRYDKNIPEEESEIIVAKQRGGPTGSFPVRFNPKLTSFSDYEYRPISNIHTREQEPLRTEGSSSQNNYTAPVIRTLT